MIIRLSLLAALGLFSGCVMHTKTEVYRAVKDNFSQVGDRRVGVYITPTTKITRHETRAERWRALMFFQGLETGPYTLRVFLRMPGIENDVPFEVTAAKLRLASGEVIELLSPDSPSLKTVTKQAEQRSKYSPRDTFSSCEIAIPLGDRLVFLKNTILRAMVTVRVGGVSEETALEVEFKTDKGSEYWGPLTG